MNDRLLTTLACALLVGCLSTSAPLAIEWYSLEAFHEPPRIATLPPERRPGLAVTLGGARARAQVEERFATQLEGGRVRFSEPLRWVEGPEVVLQRRLTERLAQDPRIELTDAPGSTSLELELLEFGERLTPAGREARIVLRLAVASAGGAVELRRYEGARIVERPGPGALVEGLSRELDSQLAFLVEDLVEPAAP